MIKALDRILEYYAETVLNSSAIYDRAVLNEQGEVLKTELKRKGYEGVTRYVEQHQSHLLAFLKDARVDRAAWLEQCKAVD